MSYLHTSERDFYNCIQLQVMICAINVSLIFQKLLSPGKLITFVFLIEPLDLLMAALLSNPFRNFI